MMKSFVLSLAAVVTFVAGGSLVAAQTPLVLEAKIQLGVPSPCSAAPSR